jgi:hypothetical protein
LVGGSSPPGRTTPKLFTSSDLVASQDTATVPLPAFRDSLVTPAQLSGRRDALLLHLPPKRRPAPRGAGFNLRLLSRSGPPDAPGESATSRRGLAEHRS